MFCDLQLYHGFLSVAVTESVDIVLAMPIQAPPTPHHTPKGLDAPLMSPMTNRTGPRGRSETTFVAVAVGRDRGRDRVDRACNDDPSPHPTTHPKTSMDLRQQGQ